MKDRIFGFFSRFSDFSPNEIVTMIFFGIVLVLSIITLVLLYKKIKLSKLWKIILALPLLASLILAWSIILYYLIIISVAVWKILVVFVTNLWNNIFKK